MQNTQVADAATSVKVGKDLTDLKEVIKSTALDAKLTRQEEQKIKSSQKILQYQYWPRVDPDKESLRFWDLRSTRKNFLRPHSRALQLAYGFLRGVPYKRIESKTRPLVGYYEVQDWENQKRTIKDIAQEYGGKNFDNEIETWLTL